MYPAPIVVALIRRDRLKAVPQYLLIKRSGRSYTGHWALVGGKWDFGETLATAIVREVKEETNLDATFVAVRGIVSERLAPPQQKDLGAHFLLFVCELTAPDGKAQEQKEGRVAWYTPAEIDALHAQNAIIPSDYAMIRAFAGSAESVPHVEAEMMATIQTDEKSPIKLLRFERIDTS